MLHFIDFEVFKEDWLCVIINPQRRTETVIVNDIKQLDDYYQQYKNEIFVGFNIRQYDQYIFKSILLNFDPKEVNDWIIVKNMPGWRFSNLFNCININFFDIMTTFHGLKTLEGFMGNNIKETGVRFDIDRKLTPAEIEETIKYCRHDVQQTIKVFLQRKEKFDAHLALLKTFDLPLKYISKTQAQLAAIILCAKRCVYNDEWKIRLPETLQLGKYKAVGDWFMNKNNHKYDEKLSCKIANVPHVFAWGGVHGAIDNYIHSCKDDELFIMADVDQLYPTIMVEYNLLSRAVTKPERFKNILAKSLELKALGKKKERQPYKDICNITYGAEGDEYNPMYDPLHRNLVCVFGQVFMIDLIDKIENICDLIQSNTDGILIKIKKNNIDRFKQEVEKWQNRTRLHMSFDEYVKVIQKDVNNYIAVDKDGNYKSKGAYVKKLNDLDYDLAIVNEALINYFVHNIPVEQTINTCDDLKKFQKIFRVSGSYTHALHGNKIILDKTLRVFASLDLWDGGVYKVKGNTGTPEKFPDSSINCFIVNEDVKGMKVPAKLDRQYYISLAKKRVGQFLNN